MTRVKDRSLWKKSNAASSQLRLSEKFRLQGKTDTLDQYTTLPNIRKRMHGEADTFHLLEPSEKEEALQKARNHLDVSRKDFNKERMKTKTPSKYPQIDNSLNSEVDQVSFTGGFVDTHKSSKEEIDYS